MFALASSLGFKKLSILFLPTVLTALIRKNLSKTNFKSSQETNYVKVFNFLCLKKRFSSKTNF